MKRKKYDLDFRIIIGLEPAAAVAAVQHFWAPVPGPVSCRSLVSETETAL
jgi:hypothetical protein